MIRVSDVLHAAREVKRVFRNPDLRLFETDDGDLRVRELSVYEKDALNYLYMTLNAIDGAEATEWPAHSVMKDSEG